MTDREKLYKSWMIPGSYFSEMLDCGSYYNQAVQMALKYLPQAVLEENKDKLVFITTAQRDGCRVARHYCENREVILFSERILPKQGADEGQPEFRYFIYVVLHEVLHAIKKHKSPKFDELTPAYCAMYNLTQGRYVAPFVILTLQGLTLELKEGNNGRVHHGTTIQAGVFTIHL